MGGLHPGDVSRFPPAGARSKARTRRLLKSEPAAPGTDRSGADSGLVSRARLAVTSSRGWCRVVFAAGAGALSVLALAPFFLWPVLFLTLPVLVWLIDGACPSPPVTAARRGKRGLRRAFTSGWWFGFGYFTAGLFWIGEAFLVEADKFAWALPLAVTGLPAYLALYTGAATAAARLFWMPGVARLFVLAVALAGAEWLRGHMLTGFPWNVLGTALTYPLPLMQGVAVAGIYGLTLWTVVIAAAPLVLAADGRQSRLRRPGLAGVALAAVPLAALFAYGALRLSAPPVPMIEGARLRIAQPSVPQRDKWRPEKQREIFESHIELSRHDATGARDDLRPITHLVWPEAAMPFMPLDTPEALSAIGGLLPDGTHLLAGALRIEPAGEGGGQRALNSFMAFRENGALAALYDKIHLVPFGEYLPFQRALERLGLEQLSRMRGGFSAGRTPRPLLDIAGLPPIGVLICYEAIFPDEVVEGDRPDLLVNVTNDGWFGHTTGPHQHFHQARLRAVEQGLPLVRAANNGISAVIDGRGRILHQLGLDERGVIDAGIPARDIPPLYARWGDWGFLVNALAFGVFALALGRNRLPPQ